MADGGAMNGGGSAHMAGAVVNDRRTGQFATGQELTDLQRAFVTAYVENGGVATRAAAEAGYGDPKGAGHHNMRNPAILRAIREETHRVLYAEVGAASVRTVLAVLRADGAKTADRVQAARLGAEMAGLIKRDKGRGENPLDNKPLSEMTLAELETFISAGNAALANRSGPVLIEGEAAEALDNAQDNAQLPGD